MTPDLIGPPPPPLKAIHLQYHDPEYDHWHDTTIHIDLENNRIHQCESWFLGKQHESSGAIGVILFSAPALLLGAPYIWSKNKLQESREEKTGMSRHAIALMKELEGKLDPLDEAMLREALQNEWLQEKNHQLKFGQKLNFEEACQYLDERELLEKTHQFKTSGRKHHSHFWFDDDEEVVGRSFYFPDEDTFTVKVLCNIFKDEEARELLKHFKTLRNE